MKSEKLKLILKGIWAFGSYVFVPQRRTASEGCLEPRRYRIKDLQRNGTKASGMHWELENNIVGIFVS